MSTDNQSAQSALVLRDWLRERGANARGLAALKTGQDRAGWLEDAAYFDAAALAVSRATPPTPEQAGPSGEALTEPYASIKYLLDSYPGSVRSCYKGRDEDLIGSLSITFIAMRAALASPGAMEGAQAAQPLTDRQQRVVTVALFRFASDARSRAEAAAQDKEGRYFKPGDVAAFMRDAEDAEALLKVDLLRAHPPTGEPT